MPRGVYPRKPKKDAQNKSTAAKRGGDPVIRVLDELRTQRTRAEDRVVAIGTAIEALEALEER